MPIHEVTLPDGEKGWQWGEHGHKYRSRAAAERQAAAAHAHGYTGDAARAAAGVILRAPDGTILFLKRGASGDHVGEWCFPGGSAEPGEDAEETARRELMEETGFSTDAAFAPVDRRFDNDLDFSTFLHDAPKRFDPKLNDEHTDFVWAPLDNPPAPLHPSVKETLAGDVSEKAISERIKREIERGHDPKQAAAIAYSELGEDAGDFVETDHPRSEDGRFAAGNGGSIAEEREEKAPLRDAREYINEGFAAPNPFSKRSLHVRTPEGVKKKNVSSINQQHLLEGFGPDKNARYFTHAGRIYVGPNETTTKTPLREASPEDIEAAKAHAAKKLEELRDRMGEHEKRFEKPALTLGNALSKHGYRVKVVHPDDTSSRYLYVTGQNGTIKIRFADHGQPVIGGTEVGGYSKKTGKRHESADYSIDPTTKNTDEGAESLVKTKLVPFQNSASDEALALDRKSARSYDADGRLHVAATNISKATVNPYFGREIPDYRALGLDPDKTYQLLRHPDELKKAAPSFNNLPILSRHVPVTADDHQPDLVIGATGSDAEFAAPYLRNSLVIWARDAIDDIESEVKKELSCAYRYRAEMTPGTYEGQAYDGVMRDIVGNHVALVREGRAGPDVVVGDSAPPSTTGRTDMTKPVVLTRKAAVAKGALLAFLRPKLAQDQNIDVTPLLATVTAKNFKESKPAIIAGLKDSAKGKLAKDASIDDVAQLLDALEDVEVAEGADIDPNSGLPVVGKGPKDDDTAMDDESLSKIKADLLAFLKGKIGEEDHAKVAAMLGQDEETEEERKKREEEEARKRAEDEEKKDMVTKSAMDAAIADATQKAAANALKIAREIRDAERAVRPYVGDLAMAHDSADAVYATALKALGVKVDGIHASAFPALLAAQPLPSSKKPAHVAMDTAGAKGFAERFPAAARINTI